MRETARLHSLLPSSDTVGDAFQVSTAGVNNWFYCSSQSHCGTLTPCHAGDGEGGLMIKRATREERDAIGVTRIGMGC